MLTIENKNIRKKKLINKYISKEENKNKVIVIIARCTPGDPNSSYLVEEIIKKLLSESEIAV